VISTPPVYRRFANGMPKQEIGSIPASSKGWMRRSFSRHKSGKATLTTLSDEVMAAAAARGDRRNSAAPPTTTTTTTAAGAAAATAVATARSSSGSAPSTGRTGPGGTSRLSAPDVSTLFDPEFQAASNFHRSNSVMEEPSPIPNSTRP
jgi:hypothetical protein